MWPFQDSKRADAAGPLYNSVVAQARNPEFYRDLGVADTVDGRFDMVTLHAFLVMRRLREDGPAGAETAQALFDYMFADMDRNLREMGAGDLGVWRRVKNMARAFYGRVAAYEAGLGSSGPELSEALRRNLYRDAAVTDSALKALTAYVRREAEGLSRQNPKDVAAGRVVFGPIAAPPGEAAPRREAG